MPVQTEPNKRIIRIGPQSGFQVKVLSCPADIAVVGGGAGPGKTWALMMDAARHHKREGWRALVLRRTAPEITNPGAMWDESFKIYPKMGGKPTDLTWRWGKGTSIRFGHCQYDKDRFGYDGAQAAFVGFDQVEHFTSTIFWHLWSRMRSTCGVRPYVRATANPVPEDDAVGGWVHKLIQWWINPDTGLIIPERDGVIRWFYREEKSDDLVWASSKEELLQQMPWINPADAISFTFIEGKLSENVILKEVDPGYEAKLRALPKIERERLMNHNWNARPMSGSVFNRAWFRLVDVAPIDTNWVRYYDKAGTSRDENPLACYSVGVKMGYSPTTKRYYVGHVWRDQVAEIERERMIRQLAEMDTSMVTIYVEQEPGSGGKESARNTIISTLAGFACFADKVKGDKYVRAKPYIGMVQAMNVSLVKGEWNEAYLSELHNYVPNGSGYMDQVDASSGAFNKLTGGKQLELLTPEITEAVQAQMAKEANELAIEHVKRQGVVFPGEW